MFEFRQDLHFLTHSSFLLVLKTEITSQIFLLKYFLDEIFPQL